MVDADAAQAAAQKEAARDQHDADTAMDPPTSRRHHHHHQTDSNSGNEDPSYRGEPTTVLGKRTRKPTANLIASQASAANLPDLTGDLMDVDEKRDDYFEPTGIHSTAAAAAAVPASSPVDMMDEGGPLSATLTVAGVEKDPDYQQHHHNPSASNSNANSPAPSYSREGSNKLATAGGETSSGPATKKTRMTVATAGAADGGAGGKASPVRGAGDRGSAGPNSPATGGASSRRRGAQAKRTCASSLLFWL